MIFSFKANNGQIAPSHKCNDSGSKAGKWQWNFPAPQYQSRTVLGDSRCTTDRWRPVTTVINNLRKEK